MSFWLALLLSALAFVVLGSGSLLGIGLVAAPRGITTGPVVTIARLLFVAVVMAAAVAIVALIVGVATSWV